jgi:hypothetical protein
VISNHLDAGLSDNLNRLQQSRPTFTWTHIGLPHNSRPVTAATLEPFDAVATIGRTVLLAGAVGKPCLVYDVHGCDGWLTPDSLDALATKNFSGRLFARRPCLEELAALLFDASRVVDTDGVIERLGAAYRLSHRALEIEVLYERARRPGAGLTEGTRSDYGRLGEAYGALVLEARHQNARLQEALAERDEALARLATLSESDGVRLLGKLKRLPLLYGSYRLARVALARRRG